MHLERTDSRHEEQANYHHSESREQPRPDLNFGNEHEWLLIDTDFGCTAAELMLQLWISAREAFE
jgi:hypothetical protein